MSVGTRILHALHPRKSLTRGLDRLRLKRMCAFLWMMGLRTMRLRVYTVGACVRLDGGCASGQICRYWRSGAEMRRKRGVKELERRRLLSLYMLAGDYVRLGSPGGIGRWRTSRIDSLISMMNCRQLFIHIQFQSYYSLVKHLKIYSVLSLGFWM